LKGIAAGVRSGVQSFLALLSGWWSRAASWSVADGDDADAVNAAAIASSAAAAANMAALTMDATAIAADAASSAADTAAAGHKQGSHDKR
jgi:hypothetical protein